MQFEKMDTGKNYIGITERKREKLGRIDKVWDENSTPAEVCNISF